MRIGILTAGGDCPGLNAVIRAIARSAFESGDSVLGIKRAYEGLANRDYWEMGLRDVSVILHLGGTILGTSSFKPHREGAVQKIKDAMHDDEISVVTVS